MDVLLQKKQDTLKSQFTAMETALQQSQSQGQWLAGQIAPLPARLNPGVPAADYLAETSPPFGLRGP